MIAFAYDGGYLHRRYTKALSNQGLLMIIFWTDMLQWLSEYFSAEIPKQDCAPFKRCYHAQKIYTKNILFCLHDRMKRSPKPCIIYHCFQIARKTIKFSSECAAKGIRNPIRISVVSSHWFVWKSFPMKQLSEDELSGISLKQFPAVESGKSP